MSSSHPAPSTGLPGLDRLLTGLLAGDNVIWQTASVAEYEPFVKPYSAWALAQSQPLVYFRFAGHAPLVPPGPGVQIHELHPEAGFESFVSEVHGIVQKNGSGGCYVFDSLSELAADWHSDEMLANFFVLTCPYLYEVGAIAYFCLLRGRHAPEAVATITDTAQVLLDVFNFRGETQIQPLKVQKRFSPTIYMLHSWDGEEFRPVSDSATISDVRTSGPWPGLEGTAQVGLWERAFIEAEETLAAHGADSEQAHAAKRDLLRLAVTRDERMLALAEEHLSLADVFEIRKRMLGTGLIGGKSVGMLLARAILRNRNGRWTDLLEPHDSFYVGSDVYYSFVVKNGLWWVRERQKQAGSLMDGAENARRRMEVGTFPEYVIRHFSAMLDYFGQSPIIVRSSSLLEDNFGNAFAGKYDSIFLANQGSRQERLEGLLAGVRTVYASTMSEKALTYRAQRGLLERDEQMALLVQRVSGRMYGRLFYPQLSGVGLSYNPYAWSEYIEPEAGMVRLVFGLGTRAVDRSDDDYTRIVALNAPERRPESSIGDFKRYSQRKVDVLDLEANQFASGAFEDIVRDRPDLPLDMFVTAEPGEGPAGGAAALTFAKFLEETGFVPDMREMLGKLEEAYRYPVDVEFTANFAPAGGLRINVVQCRPLQVKGGGAIAAVPEVPENKLVFKARGAVVGKSRVEELDRIVYIVPETYSKLPEQARYAVARLLGRLLHPPDGSGPGKTILIGPGRWGTTTPSLGVPVSFAEISGVSILCEIVGMHEGLVPDVSLGTHFFNELVETDMLYLALFPGKDGNLLNQELLGRSPNLLETLLPEQAAMASVVRVFGPPGSGKLKLVADALSQKAVCFLEERGERGARI